MVNPMSEPRKAFWKVNHPYMAPEGNYFANWMQMQGFNLEFDTWEDFLDEMKEADEDYNFLYRWDYHETDPEDYDLEEEDEIPPNRLKFVYILQRKANFLYVTVNNPRIEDEESIRNYLTGKWEHVRRLWAPLSEKNDEEVEND
jgi:hypothetical protein